MRGDALFDSVDKSAEALIARTVGLNGFNEELESLNFMSQKVRIPNSSIDSHLNQPFLVSHHREVQYPPDTNRIILL